MFPRVLGSNFAEQTTGATHTANLPASISAGQFLLLIVTTTGATVSTPSGWTLEGSNGADPYCYVFSRVATGSEGATVALTLSASVHSNSVCYRMDQTRNRVAVAFANGSSDPNPPNLTPPGGAKNYTWFAVGVMVNFRFAYYPSNYTQNQIHLTPFTTGNNNTYNTATVSSRELNAASEDPGLIDFNGTGANCGCTIAVYPPPEPPLVTTNAVSPIQINTAIGNGIITDNGGEDCNESGFVWDTVSRGNPGNVEPETSAYSFYISESGTFGVGAIDALLSSLLEGTLYYVRAYAKNSYGITYGSEVTFTTDDEATIDTEAVFLIAAESAVARGEIVDDGGIATVNRVGFVWDTSPQSLPADVLPTASGYDFYKEYSYPYIETNFFNVVIDNLTPFTTYYGRAFSNNDAGYSYGDEVSFTTKSKPVINQITLPGTHLGVVQNITISGSGFVPGVTVKIDGVTCTNIIRVNSNTITCDVPSSLIAKVSELIVENIDGEQAISPFYYIAEVAPPAPEGVITASFSVQAVQFLK